MWDRMQGVDNSRRYRGTKRKLTYPVGVEAYAFVGERVSVSRRGVPIRFTKSLRFAPVKLALERLASRGPELCDVLPLVVPFGERVPVSRRGVPVRFTKSTSVLTGRAHARNDSRRGGPSLVMPPMVVPFGERVSVSPESDDSFGSHRQSSRSNDSRRGGRV